MVETTKARKKRKKGNKKMIMLLFLIVLLPLSIFYYKNSFIAIDLENPVEIEVEIPSGSSSTKISNILKEKGLIRNGIIFKIAMKNKEADGKLKAGIYILNTGMDLNTIIDELTKGSKNTNVARFTIPEGYELVYMADKLANENLVDREKFLNLAQNKENFEDKFPFLKELDNNQSLEGFLFPSTYEIYEGSTEEDIIEKMLAEFEKVYEKDIKSKIEESDLSLNEVVTLASIIEREGKRDDERELISAVFHNRLAQDMLLQSCATVQYALGERKERLTDKDTQIQSDYNTYIHQGLPPAPIASPGEKSLIAAVNPAEVDYLYFRTKEDGTGAHTFSKTYKEHLNANPNK